MCSPTTFNRTPISTKKSWIWGPAQQEAFEKLKAEIATLRVLAHYDVTVDTKNQC